MVRSEYKIRIHSTVEDKSREKENVTELFANRDIFFDVFFYDETSCILCSEYIMKGPLVTTLNI